jgi:TetR/AcrR family transcriptional regulator, transcriptional repressor for nem operon
VVEIQEVQMTGSRPATATGTAAAILDVAERLVQARGFNGFSYADIAAELGLTKAALHYHFSGKEALGESLISRYAARFRDTLASIDAQGTAAPEKLQAYCEIYRAALRDDRMCLCGMLAAEYNTLPRSMRRAIVAFFDENEVWLTALLETGRAAGTLGFVDSAHQAAQMIIAALEGAMLVARPYHNTAPLESVAARINLDFVPTPPARTRRGGGTRKPPASSGI